MTGDLLEEVLFKAFVAGCVVGACVGAVLGMLVAW